jgi:hypothetical protein
MKKLIFIVLVFCLGGCKGRSLSPSEEIKGTKPEQKITRVPIDTTGLNCSTNVVEEINEKIKEGEKEFLERYPTKKLNIPPNPGLLIITKSEKIFVGIVIKTEENIAPPKWRITEGWNTVIDGSFKVEIPILNTYKGELVTVRYLGYKQGDRVVGLPDFPYFVDNERVLIFLEKIDSSFATLVFPYKKWGFFRSDYVYCKIKPNGACHGILMVDDHYLCIVKSLLETIDEIRGGEK